MQDKKRRKEKISDDDEKLSYHYEDEYVSGLLLSLIKLTQRQDKRFLSYLLQMAYAESIKKK